MGRNFVSDLVCTVYTETQKPKNFSQKTYRFSSPVMNYMLSVNAQCAASPAIHDERYKSGLNVCSKSGLRSFGSCRQLRTLCITTTATKPRLIATTISISSNSTNWIYVGTMSIDKKALLSQRRPRDALNIWVPWKVSRVLANAPGYFSRNL